MIFDNEETEALKQYLSTTVDPICDADPEKLADYVIALLKHDKPEKELKNLCINQLEEFLRDETENFINQLFVALSNKSYINGDKTEILSPSIEIEEKTSDLKRSHDTQEPKEDSDQSDDDRNFKHTRKTRESRSSSNTRKSDYEEQPSKRHRSLSKSNIKNESNEKHINRNTFVRGGQQEKDINNSNEKLGKRRRNDDNDGKGSGKYIRSSNGNPNDEGMKSKPNYSSHQNQNNSNNGMLNNKHMNSQHSSPNPINQDYNYMNSQRNNGGGNGGGQRDSWYNQNSQGVVQNIPNSQGRFRGRNQQSFRNVNNNGMFPRRRCIDYEEKGICLRGDSCPYDHGRDRIVLDEMASNRRNFDNMLPNNIPTRIIPGLNQTNFNHNQFINSNRNFEPEPVYSANAEGYDPEQASFNANIVPPQWGNTSIDTTENSFQSTSNPIKNLSQEQNEEVNTSTSVSTIHNDNSVNTNTNLSSNSNRGRGGRGRGRGRGGFGFSRHGQQSMKQPILNIENIPAEYFAIDKINNYFKKFGTIININLNPRHFKATIQFSQYSEANKAYSNPDPIFGNRFVKLYWAKPATDSDLEEKSVGATTSTGNEKDESHMNTNVSSHNEKAKPAEEPKLPPISEEEMIQINLMKKSMVNRQLEKQKVLMKQIETNKAITPREKEDILKNIKLITESVKHIMNTSPQNIKALAGNAIFSSKETSSNTKNSNDKEHQHKSEESITEPATNTLSATTAAGNTDVKAVGGEQPKLTPEEQALKEKVESLKAEAASVGVDPSEITTSLSLRGRGGYRGRGRGLYGGTWSRGARSFKLDNRPTRILIKGFSEANQALIRPHFELFGIVESFQMNKDEQSAIVHYQNRRSAEQAFIYGKKLEGVAEPLELSWYTGSMDSKNNQSPAVAAALAQLENKINHTDNNQEKEKENTENDNEPTYE